jgi:hypothetical protein
MHRSLKFLLICLMAVSQALTGSRLAVAQSVELTGQGSSAAERSFAQYQPLQQPGYRYTQDSVSVDFEPPLIEHELIAEAEADIRQTFVATVVDDEELDSVLFYYRFAGETSFSRYAMMQLSSSSTYIAQIPTDPDSDRAIEYYIQARDSSGNRTVRGYTFSPLVRQIVPAPDDSAGTDRVVDSAEGSDVADEGGRFPKAVYIVGGVLLLGLIAGAAGGGSDAENNSRVCGTDGCRVNLTVNQPF